MKSFSYILNFNRQNLNLAKFEFETLYLTYFNLNVNLKKIDSKFFYFESKIEIENFKEFLYRLTYTNYISKIYDKFINFNEFEKKIKDKNFNLSFLENKKFLVRIKKEKDLKIDFLESDFAIHIWKKLKNPKVDIKNSDFEFNIFFLKENNFFYFTLKIFENKKEFLSRMPKKRPIKMPYTLKSDMARSCVNLLGLKSGLIVDPFCGIGGILIEAFDMKFDILANDISWNDLKYFKTNLEYFFNLKKSENKFYRTLADSQNQFLKNNKIDGIVTDIPYGKCSRILGDDLYDNFLKNAKKYLKKNKRIVIIYANFTNFKKIALKHFNLVLEIEEYINKSMIRFILVLENSK